MLNRNIDNYSKPKRCNRPRPLPPDVTARNLSMEKQRREAMNDKFLDLARLVPALALTRRLTKVLILNESIEHFRQQQAMCIAAAQEMQVLLAENERLVSELNVFRSQVGQASAEPKAVTEAMTQLMGVKDEIYGTFPAGFGDNWAGDSFHNQLMIDGNAQDMQLSIDGSLQLPHQPHAEEVPPHNEVDFLRNDVCQTMPFPRFQEAPYSLDYSSCQLEASSPSFLSLFTEPVGSSHHCPSQGLFGPTDTTTASQNHQVTSEGVAVSFNGDFRYNSGLG